MVGEIGEEVAALMALHMRSCLVGAEYTLIAIACLDWGEGVFVDSGDCRSSWNQNGTFFYGLRHAAGRSLLGFGLHIFFSFNHVSKPMLIRLWQYTSNRPLCPAFRT